MRLIGENRVAKVLQEYINRKFEEYDADYIDFHYDDICKDTGYTRNIIEKFLQPIGHGNNGIGVHGNDQNADN